MLKRKPLSPAGGRAPSGLSRRAVSGRTSGAAGFLGICSLRWTGSSGSSNRRASRRSSTGAAPGGPPRSFGSPQLSGQVCAPPAQRCFGARGDVDCAGEGASGSALGGALPGAERDGRRRAEGAPCARAHRPLRAGWRERPGPGGNESTGPGAVDADDAGVQGAMVRSNRARRGAWGWWVPPSDRGSRWWTSRKRWFEQPGTTHRLRSRRRTARRVAGRTVWVARPAPT